MLSEKGHPGIHGPDPLGDISLLPLSPPQGDPPHSKDLHTQSLLWETEGPGPPLGLLESHHQPCLAVSEEMVTCVKSVSG